MNLYAIVPTWADHREVGFILTESDDEAMSAGLYAAAHDAVKGSGSPTAEVYLVERDVQHVGQAHATDAPSEWAWAHPAVEERMAELAADEAEYSITYGSGEAS